MIQEHVKEFEYIFPYRKENMICPISIKWILHRATAERTFYFLVVKYYFEWQMLQYIFRYRIQNYIIQMCMETELTNETYPLVFIKCHEKETDIW